MSQLRDCCWKFLSCNFSIVLLRKNQGEGGELVSNSFKRIAFIFHRILSLQNIAFPKSTRPNLKHRMELVSTYYHFIHHGFMGNGSVQGCTAAFVYANYPSLSLFLHLSYLHDWQLRLEKGDKVTQKFKSSAFRPQYTPNSCLYLIEKHGG